MAKIGYSIQGLVAKVKDIVANGVCGESLLVMSQPSRMDKLPCVAASARESLQMQDNIISGYYLWFTELHSTVTQKWGFSVDCIFDSYL